MTMGDRIMVLRFGQIQQIGQPETLYNQPANIFVAQFIGSSAMNVFAGRLEGTGPELALVADIGHFASPPESVARINRDSTSPHGPREVMCGIRHNLQPLVFDITRRDRLVLIKSVDKNNRL